MARNETIEVYETKNIDLDQILSELGGGIRVVVNRIEPRWCDGYLDTLYVDNDDQLSIEDLRDMFGGRKLSIKVLDSEGKIRARRTIKFPDPPKKDGRVVYEDSGNGNGKKSGEEQTTLMKLLLEQQAANNQAMMGFMREQTETVRSMMSDRLSDLKAQQRSSNNGGFGDMENSLKLIDTLEAMRERLKGDGEDGETQIIGQMLGMAENYFTAQMQMKQQAQQVAYGQTAPPLPERETPQREISDAELLQKAAQRFRSMPLERQQQAAQMFFGQLSSGADSNNDIGSASNKVAESQPIDGPRVELDEEDETELAELESTE